MMLYCAMFLAWCCLSKVQAVDDASPKIIIIGAGASGIAAASRLLQNGFNNITILEAENRVGGRIYTTKFGKLTSNFIYIIFIPYKESFVFMKI